MRTVLLALVGVIMVAGGIWRCVQLWRDSTADLDAFPSPFLRAFPSIVGTTIALFGGGLLVWLARGDDETNLAAQAIAWLAAVSVLVGIVFCATTALSGRPKWVVPPHLRLDRDRR